MNELLKQLRERRAALHESAEKVTVAAATENRDLTDDEQTNFDDLAGQIEATDARIKPLEDFELRSIEAAATSRKVDEGLGIEPGTTTKVRVGDEPIQYRDGGEHSFFADFLAVQENGDFEARDRLGRHAVEMRATTTTSYGGGLVVPQYLQEKFAPILREAAPFIAALDKVPLPPKGMLMTLPKGTTGTSVASQTTQNTAVSETDYVADVVNFPVITVAGAQEISYQALDRGENIDQIIFRDLVAAYAVELDRQALVGTGTNSTFTQHEGVVNAENILTLAGANVSTFGEFWVKVWAAWAEVRNARKLPPTHMVVSATRWAWLAAATDTTGRPLMSGVNPTNAPGSFTGGQLGALTAIVDPNLEDDMLLVLRIADLIFAEEANAPRQIRLDAPKGKNLTSQLVAYGYSAFTAERYPEAICLVDGMVAPTFAPAATTD